MKRLLLLAILPALPLAAVTVRTGQETLTIAAGETIDDSLVASAETIRIDGNIRGDVVLFARRIEANGEIQGNLIAFAQNLTVAGPVNGSLAGFAQTVTLTGEVGRNAITGAQDVRVEKSAHIHGDVVAFAASLITEGAVTRGIRAFAQSARLGGSVGRNVDFYGEEVELQQGASIAGDVKARVRNADRVRVAPGVVRGKVDTIRTPEAERSAPPVSEAAGFAARMLWETLWFAAAFLVGWLLYRVAPRMVDRAGDSIESGVSTLGLGFAILFLTPVFLVFVGLTVIGIPAALIGGALFAMALYGSKIVVGFWVGRRLAPAATPAVRLLAGLAVVSFVLLVPYAGWLARLVITCAGLGGLALVAWQWSHPAPPPGPALRQPEEVRVR
jgi:cytoskeletal protein CcmA (bactofilin family)